MIERINGVSEVDCLKCKNCDLENDRCKLYGSDPKKAAERCAASYFRGYRKKAEHGTE